MSQRYSSSFCSSWVVPSQIPSPTTTTITSSNSSYFSSPPNLPRDSNTPPPAPKKESIVRSKPTQQHQYTRVYPPSWTVTSLFPPTPVSPPSTQTYHPQSNYNQPSTAATTPTPTAANNISFSPAAMQIQYFQRDTTTSAQNSSGVADAPAKQPAGYGAHCYSASMCITTTLPVSTYPYPPKPPMTRTAPWKAPGGYAYPETCGGYTPQPTSAFSGAADQPAHAPLVAPSYSPSCRM
ncbi:hypothetical protein K440DRAFT_627491 [Wilcoxina mikolae CBS 423.85]|nr:hypothetical protein K440DRAFT_627491 [Wilcoxina mikolae CBS 423.85]